MSKSISLKPKYMCDKTFGSDADGNRGIFIEWFECPSCWYAFGDNIPDACPECGQKIDINEKE